MPLCYSTIPDNTFKAFYLAFNVNSDPNWGNKVYRDSFAKATWATQVFSYYGARIIGIVGHDMTLDYLDSISYTCPQHSYQTRYLKTVQRLPTKDKMFLKR